MENKQFVYTKFVEQEGKEAVLLTDTFSLDKVIRTVEMEDGRRLVLLNDIHERTLEVPDINVKTNKVMGMKRERNTYQSEVILNKEDSIRFLNLFK